MLRDFRAAVLADAPKAFWLLDLAELGPSPGLPLDLTGHGYNMAASSGTGIVYYPGLSLHGETEAVRFTNSEFSGPVVPTPGSWAAEVWFANASVVSGGYTIFYNGHWTGASGGDGYGIAATPAGAISIIANGFNDSVSHSFPLTGTNTWTQVVLSYVGGATGLSVWVNGVPDAGNPWLWTHLPVAPTTASYIAKNQGGASTPTTTNLALAIWDGTLTNAQVLAHYNAMFTLSTVDGDYPFLSLVHPGGGTQQPASGRIRVL